MYKFAFQLLFYLRVRLVCQCKNKNIAIRPCKCVYIPRRLSKHCIQVSDAKALQRVESKAFKTYKPDYHSRIDYALKIATALRKVVPTTAALILCLP